MLNNFRRRQETALDRIIAESSSAMSKPEGHLTWVSSVLPNACECGIEYVDGMTPSKHYAELAERDQK